MERFVGGGDSDVAVAVDRGDQAAARERQFGQRLAGHFAGVLDLQFVQTDVAGQFVETDHGAFVEKAQNLTARRITFADGHVDAEFAHDIGVVGSSDHAQNAAGTHLTGLHAGHDVALVAAGAGDKVIDAAGTLVLEDRAAVGVGVHDGCLGQQRRQLLATRMVVVQDRDPIIATRQRFGQVVSSFAAAGDQYRLAGQFGLRGFKRRSDF